MHGLRARTVVGVIAVVSAVLVLGLPFTGVRAQGAVDADADHTLRAMSDYLGHLVAFSADYDVDTEIIDHSGQKLDFVSSGSLLVQRPGKIYATRLTGSTDAEVYLAGGLLTVYGKGVNAYAQIANVGSIDAAIEAVRSQWGFDVAGADLLYANPYPGLMTDVMSGVDLGPDIVDGIAAVHLAFRAAQVDWQVWVQPGARPLPLKYVITSKWVTGAPQYVVELRNWNVNPSINEQRFAFAPPQGARKITTIPTNVIGEIGEGQR